MHKNNILRVFIDFLFKLLYNKKRLLCNFAFHDTKYRLAALFCTLALFCGGVVRSSADLGSSKEVILSISAEICRGGTEVLLSLVKKGGADFCGVLLELQYPEGLTFLEGTSVNLPADAELSYLDRDGRLRILIDSAYNVDSTGVLAEFGFSVGNRTGDETATASFALFDIGGAYAFSEDAALVRLSVRTEDACGVEFEKDEALNRVQLLEGSSVDKAGMCLTVFAPHCFAGGVEICVVDFGGHLTQYTEVGVLASDGSRNVTVAIPKSGIVCLIIRPLGYQRNGVRLGETQVFCFGDGVLLEY